MTASTSCSVGMGSVDALGRSQRYKSIPWHRFNRDRSDFFTANYRLGNKMQLTCARGLETRFYHSSDVPCLAVADLFGFVAIFTLEGKHKSRDQTRINEPGIFRFAACGGVSLFSIKVRVHGGGWFRWARLYAPSTRQTWGASRRGRAKGGKVHGLAAACSGAARGIRRLKRTKTNRTSPHRVWVAVCGSPVSLPLVRTPKKTWRGSSHLKPQPLARPQT